MTALRPWPHVFSAKKLGLKEAFDGVPQNQLSLRMDLDDAQKNEKYWQFSEYSKLLDFKNVIHFIYKDNDWIFSPTLF